MTCPECGSWSLTSLRTWGTQLDIRRQRECKDCHHRFTTVELPFYVPLPDRHGPKPIPPRQRSLDYQAMRRANLKTKGKVPELQPAPEPQDWREQLTRELARDLDEEPDTP